MLTVPGHTQRSVRHRRRHAELFGAPEQNVIELMSVLTRGPLEPQNIHILLRMHLEPVPFGESSKPTSRDAFPTGCVPSHGVLLE